MTPSTRCHISFNKSPGKTILSHPFNHRVDFILPTDIYQLISNDLLLSPALSKPLLCHRLCIPLSAIVKTEFFTKYVKTGNVIMLSQGRIDIDNVYTLNDGVLRLSLHKETYEKAGLVGKPARFGNGHTGGRKKPSRYLVELNLRDPSMLHGKKGFDRIVWSFANVFKGPVNFIFCDLEQLPSKDASSSPPCPILAALSASPREMHTPQIISSLPVLVPEFHPPPGSKIHGGGKSQEAEYQREVWREWALHVYEWLALASLGPADRIMTNDTIDPYLSTYSVEQGKCSEGGQKMTRLTFRGIVPAVWIAEFWKTVCSLLSSSVVGKKGWAALLVHGFENSPISWNNSAHGSLAGGENGYTVLRLPLKEEDKDEGDENSRYMVYKLVGGQDEHS